MGTLTVSPAGDLPEYRQRQERLKMTPSNVEFVLPKSRHIPPPVSPLFSKSEGSSPGVDGNQKFFRSNQSSDSSRYARKRRQNCCLTITLLQTAMQSRRILAFQLLGQGGNSSLAGEGI